MPSRNILNQIPYFWKKVDGNTHQFWSMAGFCLLSDVIWSNGCWWRKNIVIFLPNRQIHDTMFLCLISMHELVQNDRPYATHTALYWFSWRVYNSWWKHSSNSNKCTLQWHTSKQGNKCWSTAYDKYQEKRDEVPKNSFWLFTIIIHCFFSC